MLLIQISEWSSPWGCSWPAAWGLVIVWYRKPEFACVPGSFCTSFLSHFLTPTLSPLIFWQPGPSGPAEGVSVYAERVGDGRLDSHTEVWTGLFMHKGAVEHYVSLLILFSSLHCWDNGKYFRIKSRICPLMILCCWHLSVNYSYVGCVFVHTCIKQAFKCLRLFFELTSCQQQTLGSLCAGGRNSHVLWHMSRIRC